MNTNNDFERVKEALKVSDVAVRFGAKMEKKFANPAPCCGNNDCCRVDDEKRLFKCFSCETGGSVIDMIMAAERCDEAEALRKGAEWAGLTLAGGTSEKKKRGESGIEKMFRLAAEYYHQVMLNSLEGKKWFLEKRGHKESTLAAMKVGWSDGKLLEYLKAEGFTASEVVSQGLASDKDAEGKEITPRDYFWKKGMAIFPVLDHAGKVITLTSKDPEKACKDLQLAGIKKKWFLNHQALGSHDLFVVEGQNDKASIIDAGVKDVVGTCGAPGQEQLLLLKNHQNNKTIYLWFDLDPDKDPRKNAGGPAHTRFIYKGLADSSVIVKVIVHPGDAKDPDEYLQEVMKRSPAEVRKAIKELKENALDPLAWEIEQLRGIVDAKDRLATLKERNIPQAVNALATLAEREIYIDLLAKAVGISVTAIEDLLESTNDLYHDISTVFRGAEGIKKADPLSLAEFIYKWFNNGAGGRFFKTADGKVFLFYHGKNYEIDNNLDFNTLMLKMTKLAAVEKPGSTVWYFLRNLCNANGERVEMMSWLYTEREKDTVYVNLNSPHNKILRIAAGTEPELIDNATNDHSILLSSSPQIRPFEYQPTASEADGFRAIKMLFMDTTPAEKPQRYFMMCWTITVFLMDYQGDRGLLQVIGSSGLGKSKVAERISQLIYGDNYVGRGTGASDVRIATHNPLNFTDNLENRDLNQGRVDFLLLLANSATKPKAKAGSDTEVIYQRLKSMGICTSIEAFPGKLPELVNRTFPLILDHQYRVHGYMHDEVMRGILKQRNLILSSIFKMIGRVVLPRLAERTDWSKFIHTKYPGHNKERMNEHLCMMMMVLEGMLEHIQWKQETPIKKQAEEILERWIAYQEEQAHQTAITSNTLLTLMDGLAKEIFVKIRGRGNDIQFQEAPEIGVEAKIFDDPEYLERFYLTKPQEEVSTDEDELIETCQRLEFIVTAADLFTIFNRFCASQHIRNPYETPNSLGARISNDRSIMEKGGWEFISKEKTHPYYKKVHGRNYWKFSRRMRVGS